jgi:exopolyphosphatase/guanosine-5'-triphosphate,3'-diphosphate pyrophosphatase
VPATRIAAIDIGSNSIRQIVADVSPDGAISHVDEMKAAPRLAAGLDASGKLDETAMARAIEALTRMSDLARQLDADRIVAVATSAVRDASNATQFARQVKKQAGLDLRILTGADEARLSYRSALAHFELGNSRAAIVDLGGGSLELALSFNGIADRLLSLPLGAVRLTERFFSKGESEKRLAKMRKYIGKVIRENVSTRSWQGVRLVGAGGTFTNLAGMVLQREGIVSAQSVQGARVSRKDAERLLRSLAAMSVEERRRVPGLNAARADIIVAGLAVVAEVMSRLETPEVEVSRYGIREGLLLEEARITPVVADHGEARAKSVLELAHRCRAEMPHAEQVQRLSLRLFDAIGQRIGLEPADRQTLADAALLHDIGHHINYERHHKHSYHLIIHADLLAMDPAEQVVIANVARYHRASAPRRKHANYGALDRSLRRRIKRLAAILRVADGFERGHVGAVADLQIRWTRRALRIAAKPRRSRDTLRLEIWGAHHKSELLARVTGVPVEIVSPSREVFSSASIGQAVTA